MIGKTPNTLWDLPTRLTHWLLAVCVVLNFFFIEEGSDVHDWLGYVAVALVVFRFVWGFVGGAHSRFASFSVSPKSVFNFVRSGFPSGKFEGHNPLASIVYLAIWFLVIALGVTGYMMDLDRFWGDEWLHNLHSQFSTALQILIGIHLLGLTLDSLRYRRGTWMSMITGRRRR